MRKYILLSVVSICLLWLILFDTENKNTQMAGSSVKGTIRVFQSFGDFVFGKSSTFINLETGRKTRVRTNKKVPARYICPEIKCCTKGSYGVQIMRPHVVKAKGIFIKTGCLCIRKMISVKGKRNI